MDHGLDRLPLFFLLLFSLIPNAISPAHATTFGPITVGGQVSYAQYVLRGRIETDPWVMVDRQYRRPQTHWKLKITQQLKGPSLGDEITIREKGGELDGFGYHVAGAASFRKGEDVFVTLQDSDEPGIKQLVGLASGKYSVEKDGAQAIVRNGLGILLRNADGTAMAPTAFTALIKRFVKGQATEADKSIFVNQGTTHDTTDPVLEKRIREAEALRQNSVSTPPPGPAKESPSAVEKTPAPTEEKEGSSIGWWVFFSACLGAALLLIFKRT